MNGSPFLRRTVVAALAAAAATPAQGANVRRPAGYPRSYDRLIAAATHEGRLVIYSSTGLTGFREVMNGFRARYPFLKVEYHALSGMQIYERVSGQAAAKRVMVDLLISSAMDYQIKLVNDGYAQPYASPERPNLPAWAVWKNEAYAITTEPVVFAYDRRRLAPEDVPRSHADLKTLLERKRETFRGKIGVYDLAFSAAGFLYLTQDVELDRDNWKLLHAIGRAQPKRPSTTPEMIQMINSGELLLGYNMAGSYGLMEQRRNPDFRIVIPNDYVLISSRIAAIPRDAPHPAAAKLFLDYVLSSESEALLARQGMGSTRTSLSNPRRTPPRGERAIRVGPGLLANLDQLTKAKFLARWRRLSAS